MKTIKRIMLIALTLVLSISLTGQAEAKLSKTVKSEVRVVNGTIIVTDKTNITRYTENGLTEYTFC